MVALGDRGMETLTARHPSALFGCLLLAPPVDLASNVAALQLQTVELLVLVLIASSALRLIVGRDAPC
jgi:hypothetical protein